MKHQKECDQCGTDLPPNHPLRAPHSELKKKGAYRKEVYALFEGLVGRQMTAAEHDSLKKMMQDYVAIHLQEVTTLNSSIHHRNQKIKQMATALLNRGRDAEILESKLLFLKKIFEEND